MKRFFFTYILIIIVTATLSQTNDGFIRYYYKNGAVSSEGVVRNNKPDGYWRNYYEDGSFKSEGNRVNFLLDSTWTFYNPDGHIAEQINYRNDAKNGYTFSYDTVKIKDTIKYYLKSKVLFYLGKREGLSYFYAKNGKLLNTINYSNDKRHGYGKIYNSDSIVTTLITYFNGYQTSNEKINRSDTKNLKQGRWIDFYPNENKHIERFYLDDKLHGIYREYDLAENLIKETTYINGIEHKPEKQQQKVELKAEVKTDYYPNGNLKYDGAFVNKIPVGIHKEYAENGKLIIAKNYSSTGKLTDEGLYDDKGLRTGHWKVYDTVENYLCAEGDYEKGLKEGLWKFYFPDATLEQEGYYLYDEPDRDWIWYFPDGKIRIQESYLSGKLEGLSKEFDNQGNIIAEGPYFDNEKKGKWVYNIGILSQKGAYDFNEQHGEWEMTYVSSGKKYFVGSFKNGDANGKHYWYYPDGRIMLAGEFRAGKPHNEWKYYDEMGNIYKSFEYRNGNITKIDNVKIKEETKHKK